MDFWTKNYDLEAAAAKEPRRRAEEDKESDTRKRSLRNKEEELVSESIQFASGNIHILRTSSTMDPIQFAFKQIQNVICF